MTAARNPGSIVLPALVLLGGAILFLACERQAAAPPTRGAAARGGPVAFPVEVAPVESRRVEYAVTGVGSVEAFERVQVTARVAGVVERVRFAEGDRVKPGQVLVEIEPQRYRLAGEAAAATVEKNQAARSEAEAGLERRTQAVTQNPGLIRGEEIETWRTRSRTATAEVAQARAALDQARLNLRDAYVRAPLAGAIETRTVQTGQYVQPGTVLATLVRRDPLLVRFRVPEPDAARLAAGMKLSFRARSDEREHAAAITHVGQVADESSRMVTVTAEVDPGSRALLRPGSFAEVTVPVQASREAAVVPQTAIRPSERGFLAFVVQGETAHERTIILGMRTAEGGVEVRSGISPGERLVVRGAEALREGAQVRITPARPDGGTERTPPPAPRGNP